MACASQFPRNGEKGKNSTQVNWNVDQRYGGTSGFQFGRPPRWPPRDRAARTASRSAARCSKFATTKQAAVYTPSEMKGRCTAGSSWSVRNDEAIGGKLLAFDLATARSVNTARLPRPQARNRQGPAHHVGDGLPPGHRGPDPVLPGGRDSGRERHHPADPRLLLRDPRGRGKYCTPNPILSITTNDEADQAAGHQLQAGHQQDVAAGARGPRR